MWHISFIGCVGRGGNSELLVDRLGRILGQVTTPLVLVMVSAVRWGIYQTGLTWALFKGLETFGERSCLQLQFPRQWLSQPDAAI